MTFLKLFLLTFLLAFPVGATTGHNSLKSALKAHKYGRAKKLLKKTKMPLKKLKKLARKTASSPLLRAIKATQKIAKKTKQMRLSKKALLNAAFFCETSPITHGAKKSRYFKKSRTHLAYDVEYDAQTHNHFIVLDGKKAFIGKGKRKQVKKAILYHHQNPKVVARAEEQVDHSRELQITKKLQDSPGMIKTIALCRLKRQGKKYSSYYSKLYRPGTLHGIVENGLPLSLFEKISIARQITKGLANLHAEGIAHRDLNIRNFLINLHGKIPGKRKLNASIADFGHSEYVSKVKEYDKIQGNTTYTAPEGLFPKNLRPIDLYQTDVFALGCVFYRLYYGNKAPWQDTFYVKETKRPVEVRYNELVGRIKEATQEKRGHLEEKEKLSPLGVEEQFELAFLTMLRIEPEKRGTSAEIAEKMDAIYNQAKMSI